MSHAVWDLAYESESVTSVYVVGTAGHVTLELAFTSEGRSSVTLAGQKNAQFERELAIESEAVSRVTITGTRTVAPDVVFVVGVPERGWRTSIIDRTTGWLTSAPGSGWSTKKPR